jgi:hypothetical protein
VSPTNFPKRKWRLLVNKSEKLSVRVQKNKEVLLNSPSDLNKKTKLETTASLNEHIDIKVFDHWLDNLDSPTRESFVAFAESNNSVIEIYLYSRFLGYNGSITSCDLWIAKHYSKPDHRSVLLSEIMEMQEDIRKLREDIENFAVKRDSGVARIAGMQKELRGTIAQVENYTANKDRKGLLMAGADQAIRELLMIFKDDPIEGPLQEASMSVWAKMQLSE